MVEFSIVPRFEFDSVGSPVTYTKCMIINVELVYVAYIA
jgi:hypothetical protein